MKYKIVIDKDGNHTTNVLDKGIHKCQEILQVVGSFGEIVDVKNKKEDDIPVKINIQNN